MRTTYRNYLDITKISSFFFAVEGIIAPTTIYLDNVRLDAVPNNPFTDAANNIWKFDCGSWESPLWPDFFRLTQNTNYPVAAGTQPYGWVDPNDSAE